MPICIAGMHRSGTSLIARLLNLCGVYLGQENELMPAGPANPEGYWENIYFSRINDSILERLEAGWDWPPEVAKGWENDRRFEDLRLQAQELVARLNSHGLWGWKDPRNSVTLPFWQSIIPDLQVVLCVRNPLEVAESLSRRGSSSILFGLRLWQIYNQRLISDASRQVGVVTHYDAYFRDPRAELRRVLALLGMSASDEVIDAACTAVVPALRHGVRPPRDLDCIPSDVLDLYLNLCAEGGQLQVNRPTREGAPYQNALAPAWPSQPANAAQSSRRELELRLFLLDAQQQLAERDELLLGMPGNRTYGEGLRNENNTLRSENDALRSERHWLKSENDSLHQHIEHLQGIIRQWDDWSEEFKKQIASLQQERQMLLTEIQRMQRTRVWQLGQIYWRVGERLRGLLK